MKSVQLSINEIKDRVPIVDFIKAYIPLRKRGSLYWGLCPFHGEKTASFAVNNEKMFFHCFGCGEHGDIFSFLQKYRNFSFAEAVAEICQKNSLPMPYLKDRQEKDIKELLNQIATLFNENINPRARDFLKTRNISEDSIQRFKIGWADGDFLRQVNAQGISMDLLRDTGILGNYGNLIFNNRIIFPICNIQGDVIGFSGRSIDNSNPKYINTKETSVFSKSCSVFNIDQAVNTDNTVVLVEGFLDVISMVQNGFECTVGSMGTAVTIEHIIYLSRKFNNIIGLFDGDEAGKKAENNFAELCLKAMNRNTNFYLAHMPEGFDPDSLIQTLGPEPLKSIINSKEEVIEFLWRNLNAESCSTIGELIQIKKKIQQFLSNMDPELRKIPEELWNQKLNSKKQELLRADRKISIPSAVETDPEIILAGILILNPEALENYLEQLIKHPYKNNNISQLVEILAKMLSEGVNNCQSIIEQLVSKNFKADLFLKNKIVGVLNQDKIAIERFIEEFLGNTRPQKPIQKSIGVKKISLTIPRSSRPGPTDQDL